jgi:hypothetical protein
MSRLDRKRGRFSVDFETNDIDQAFADWQSQNGDTVMWYRFDYTDSQINDIYDEGDGVGKVYKPPVPMPVLHATRVEGGHDNDEEGFYWNDDMTITAAFEQVRRVGLTRLDIEHQNFLKDRIEYDNRIFRISSIEILGQIQERDVIVSIVCTEVKPDELVNDPQFKRWSA